MCLILRAGRITRACHQLIFRIHKPTADPSPRAGKIRSDTEHWEEQEGHRLQTGCSELHLHNLLGTLSLYRASINVARSPQFCLVTDATAATIAYGVRPEGRTAKAGMVRCGHEAGKLTLRHTKNEEARVGPMAP